MGLRNTRRFVSRLSQYTETCCEGRCPLLYKSQCFKDPEVQKSSITFSLQCLSYRIDLLELFLPLWGKTNVAMIIITEWGLIKVSGTMPLALINNFIDLTKLWGEFFCFHFMDEDRKFKWLAPGYTVTKSQTQD